MNNYGKHRSISFIIGCSIAVCTLVLLAMSSADAKPVVVGSKSISNAGCKSEGGSIYTDTKTGEFLCCWAVADSSSDYCERCSDCKPGDEVDSVDLKVLQTPKTVTPNEESGSESTPKTRGTVKPIKPVTKGRRVK